MIGGSLTMSNIWRALGAVLTGIVATGLMLVVFSILGTGISLQILDHLVPAISGETLNTNTDDWGNLLLLPVALAGGLVSAAIIWDQKASRQTEGYTAIAVFVLLGGVSGFNFWAHDRIRVDGQMLIDLVLAIASLVVIGLLSRWTPTLPTANAIQRIALFLVTLFGFILPLCYATSLLLLGLGYFEGLGDLATWMKFVAAVLALAAAMTPSLKRTRAKGHQADG